MYVLRFENILRDIISQHQEDERVGLLYSGGIDSSVIASVMKETYNLDEMFLVSVGAEGSYDLENASNGAKELDLQLHICYIDESSVKYAIRELMELNVVNNAGEISIAVPLFLGMRYMSEKLSVNTVFLGQGADELFGGYKKYSKLYSEANMTLLEGNMKTDLDSLMNRQTVMEKQIAANFDIRLIYPFLHPNSVNFAKEIPISKHFMKDHENNTIGKVLLREVAQDIGLSKNISAQPKKALQYGSGSKKLVKRVAKDTGYSKLSEWFDSLIQER